MQSRLDGRQLSVSSEAVLVAQILKYGQIDVHHCREKKVYNVHG
jgi:hypothetical protein